jgi:metal-responsive CopG/Arc/MetJ family transcriptional regulator
MPTRRTRIWTVSLPPDMSELAEGLAREEQRTKSELIREALRLYIAQRGHPLSWGAPERLARVGELAELYRRRHALRQPTEAQLREQFRPIRRLHDRLKDLVL